MTPEEQAVINAAETWASDPYERGQDEVREAVTALIASRNPRCSICRRPLGQPGDPDSVDCGGDCAACMAEEEGGPELIWVRRTWADVRTGDAVRMPGTEVTAVITMRYLHPSEDSSGQAWHVVGSTDTGPWAHTKDHYVQPGECVVCLNAEALPRFMNPAAPVEIQTDAATARVMDLGYLGGWEARI